MSYDIPILPVFEALGGRLRSHRFNGWSAAFCPLHDDTNASAQVHEERGRWRCLVCNVNQDAIALVQHVESLPFKEALARARELAGDSDGPVRAEPRREGSLIPSRPRDRRERRAFVPPWAKNRG